MYLDGNISQILFQLKIQTKRKVIFIFLVILLIWPMIHHLLVIKYDINVWKFFGLSMYCVKIFDSHISIYETKAHSNKAPIDIEKLPESIKQKIQKFQSQRELYGKFLSPYSLAILLFEHQPQANHIVFEIEILEINKKTARIQSRMDRYEYSRDGTKKTEYNIISEKPKENTIHKGDLKSILNLIQKR